MIWDKLVDRCLLFTDAPGGLLKALLKEAEMELANKLQIFESLYLLQVPETEYGFGQSSHSSTREHNYHLLPSNYLQDIGVTHNGMSLRKMSEDEVRRKTNGQSYNGTPTAYGISGDYIIFDSASGIASGDVFIIHYKARMTDTTTGKVLTLQYYDHSGTKVYLDTDLGSALDSRKLVFEAQAKTLSAGTTAGLTNTAGLPDTFNTNIGSAPVLAGLPSTSGSSYTIAALAANGSLTGDEWANANGALVTILDYRVSAPLIPDQFHTDLCNYAVALANAKTSPETYNLYWSQWMLNMDNLINEAQDRDLIFNIREEI